MTPTPDVYAEIAADARLSREVIAAEAKAMRAVLDAHPEPRTV